GGAMVEATHNQATSLGARGTDVLVRDNHLSGHAGISAENAIVTGNTTESLSIRRPDRQPPDTARGGAGSFVAEGNVVAGLVRVANSGSAVVQDNDVGGPLEARAQHDLYVARNRARGIGCVLTASDSSLVLAENSSQRGTDAGLVVIGAGTATIENNSSSAS